MFSKTPKASSEEKGFWGRGKCTRDDWARVPEGRHGLEALQRVLGPAEDQSPHLHRVQAGVLEAPADHLREPGPDGQELRGLPWALGPFFEGPGGRELQSVDGDPDVSTCEEEGGS